MRELVHEADSMVEETVKPTLQPYFVLDGKICALLAAKHHVNVFIYDAIVADPHGIINQGHNNRTARSIQVREVDKMNEKALLAMFRGVVANNRKGGWRKLKQAT